MLDVFSLEHFWDGHNWVTIHDLPIDSLDKRRSTYLEYIKHSSSRNSWDNYDFYYIRIQYLNYLLEKKIDGMYGYFSYLQ